MNDTPVSGAREGSLEAPTRHPLDWKRPEFHDQDSLFKELERVFDICHGCRRCFSLCQAFPTLFDAIDATPDGELHGVPKKAYWQVVDNCYLCDMCYMTKCPYVPPHPWNVDFPHVMLRAKVVKHAEQRTSLRDRLGEDSCYAIADEDLERENDVKTSAVHFLRFELPPRARRLLAGKAPLRLGVDHPAYAHAVEVTVEVRAALAADLVP
jgi:ferredoxin